MLQIYLEFLLHPLGDFIINTHWHSAVHCSISQWILPTYVCPCGHYWWFVDNEHCWQLSAVGNAAHWCLYKHCWRLPMWKLLTVICLWEHCNSCLSLWTLLTVICLWEHCNSCLSLWTLLTIVCPWECCSLLPLLTLLMFICPCERCWWGEHCWWLYILVNAVEWCVEGICSCIALAGRWYTESRNLMELFLLPPTHLMTVRVRWLAYKDWTLPSGNNDLWL